MRLLVYLFAIVLLASSASAIQGSMTLLTVVNENASIGGTASVLLEIQEGSGRVFMDSYPLSGVDTQISARYAKEVACNFLEVDCSKLDFFYTIRSGSSFVSGPSAGGAFAVLTVSLLDNQPLREDVAMTGTINSGGTIGAVGGVQAKVSAAEEKGLNAVIIPDFGKDNITADIEIIRVNSIDEALYVFTGKNYSRNYVLQESQQYDDLMKGIADNICAKTEEFFSLELNESTPEYNNSLRFKNLSINSLEENDYYSAASFCFSANIRLRTLLLMEKDTLEEDLSNLIKALNNYDENLEKKRLDNLADLETYMIVKERIDEASEIVDEIKDDINVRELAYAIERYNSAVSWASFFEMNSKEVNLDEEYLQVACSNKIDEVDERISLVHTILATYENDEAINAKQSRDKRDFGLCLFKATKAKAEINAIIDGISVNINKTEDLVEGKLKLAYNAIAKEQEKGNFPILAFSYYNYASALIEEDTTNALIFSEYALEFSDLGIYFPQNRPLATIPESDDSWLLLLAGFSIGVAFTLLLVLIIKPGRNPRKKASPRKKR